MSAIKPFCPCKRLVQEFTRRFRISHQSRELAITPVDSKESDTFNPFALSKPDARSSIHQQTRLISADLIKCYAQLEPQVNHIAHSYSYHVLSLLETCTLVPANYRHELIHSRSNLSIRGLCGAIQREVQLNSKTNRRKLEHSEDGRLMSLPADRVFMPLTLASQGKKLPRNGDNILHVSFRVRILQGIYYGVHCKGDNCHYVTIYHESDLAVSDLLRAQMQHIQMECTVDTAPQSLVVETGQPIWDMKSDSSLAMPAPMPRSIPDAKERKGEKEGKEDDKEEVWSLTGQERWANTGDPLASKQVYGHFGSENPGSYLVGWATKQEQKSHIAGRTRKLRSKTMLPELVANEFMDRYIPSANRKAGPLFAPEILTKMMADKAAESNKKKPQTSMVVDMVLDKTYPEEDTTHFPDISPETVLISQSCQAFKDFKVEGGQLPDLQPGTILRLLPDEHELYFKWTFTIVVPVANSDQQRTITASGWSLKRYACLVATSSHPESKWFVTQPHVKVYSSPEADEKKLMHYPLSLAQIIQQVGKLQGDWIHHALGYSMWKNNMVPMGQSLTTLVRQTTPPIPFSDPSAAFVVPDDSMFSSPAPMFI